MEMIALQMASFLHKILIFFFLVFLLQCSSSLLLCANSRAPISLKAPLTFCPYNGSSCCNYTEDYELQKQFLSMNISDSDCGSIAKLMLCTKCNPHSSDLSRIERDSCAEVLNASIWNSSFSLAASKESSEESNSSSEPSVSVNNRLDSNPPHGICLEKIGNGSFLSMVPHPDGSNRVFLSNQEGRIWLADVPALESNKALDFDESKAFFDLTDLVYSDVEFGVMGLAFHPNFTDNGRFFVSFNCDKAQMASCSGRCSCNSEADCNPSKLGLDESAQPCRFQSVISEFTVNGTSSKPSEAASAIPSEVRRIFTMGLPYKGNHAGQIIFGPEDGYLYFMMGDGGNKGDPFNFAQNKKSVLGKILRLDVNQIPSSSEINDLDLWGNYSIPKDNPYTDDSELLPEIWALGFRNPWRCSFDSKQPSYFFCTDVGEGSYEEINLISRGGNYGWRLYEGPYLYPSSWTPGDNTSLKSVNPIFPIMGYNHSSLNNKVGSASVAGGYVYRSNTDPCLNGRFVYADLYGEAMWAAVEETKGSGIYNSTKLPFACAEDSPIACEAVEGNPLLSLVYSFAEDNDNQLYLLASKGVFRVVRPSRCGFPCASEMNTDAVSSPSGIPSSADKSVIFQLNLRLLFFLCSIKFFL